MNVSTRIDMCVCARVCIHSVVILCVAISINLNVTRLLHTPIFLVNMTRLILFCVSTAGGGTMKSMNEPPPPLAADVALHELQAQTAVENLCVASSHLLQLIRTLRLSVMLMDEDTIAAEEQLQVLESQHITEQAQQEATRLEGELMRLRNRIE